MILTRPTIIDFDLTLQGRKLLISNKKSIFQRYMFADNAISYDKQYPMIFNVSPTINNFFEISWPCLFSISPNKLITLKQLPIAVLHADGNAEKDEDNNWKIKFVKYIIKIPEMKNIGYTEINFYNIRKNIINDKLKEITRENDNFYTKSDLLSKSPPKILIPDIKESKQESTVTVVLPDSINTKHGLILTTNNEIKFKKLLANKFDLIYNSNKLLTLSFKV